MFPLRLSPAAIKYGEWQVKSTREEKFYVRSQENTLSRTSCIILTSLVGLADEHYSDKNVPI